MNDSVAQAGDLLPWNGRMARLEFLGQPANRLPDDPEIADHGVDGFLVREELVAAHPGEVTLDSRNRRLDVLDQEFRARLGACRT